MERDAGCSSGRGDSNGNPRRAHGGLRQIRRQDGRHGIRQVWQSLPAQFAKRQERFLYGLVRDGARAREYELAVQWLVDAGLVRKIDRVSGGGRLPLSAYAEPGVFKLYLVDVGLFRALADIPPRVLLNKNAVFNEFGGLLAEQFVAQQLAHHKLYYWTSDAKSEVDFVAQIDGDIVPIEVKSGLNAKAKSLRVYRERYTPPLSSRFSRLPLRLDDGLLNIPLHLSWLFDRLIHFQSSEED